MAAAPRSFLAPWMGGVSKPIASPVAFRGLLAFWLGGASQGTSIPPIPGTSEYITRARRRGRR